MSMSDQMDLLVEQVKMLAGEIAFSTSTLKRLMEQSVNDPENSKTQVDAYSLSLSVILKLEMNNPYKFPCTQIEHYQCLTWYDSQQQLTFLSF